MHITIPSKKVQQVHKSRGSGRAMWLFKPKKKCGTIILIEWYYHTINSIIFNITKLVVLVLYACSTPCQHTRPIHRYAEAFGRNEGLGISVNSQPIHNDGEVQSCVQYCLYLVSML